MFFLDKLFLVSLVLNATGLFSFIAPQLETKIGQVSLFLLAFNIAYLSTMAGRTVVFLRDIDIAKWIFVLLVWPLTTLIYAPAFDPREIGLQLYYTTLFLGTIVYLRNAGLEAFFRVLTIILVISLVGMVLSIVAPQYFEAVASLAETSIPGEETMERPTGFFMQPNTLAISIDLLFIAWFGLWSPKTIFREVVAILVLLALQIVTGSRTGLLVAIGVSAIIILNRSQRHIVRGRLFLAIGFLLLCLTVGLVGLRLYLASSSIGGFGDEGGLSDRIENIASFRISEPGGIAEDESVQQRLGVQVYYLEHIWERPLLGYGFGSKTKYLESGTFWLSPHSDAIAKAFDYGAIYPICLCLMVASLLWKRVRKNVEKTLKTNTVIQFAAAFLVLFLYSSSMENRVFYIVLGLIVFLEDDAKRKSDAPGGSGIVGIETNSPEAQ